MQIKNIVAVTGEYTNKSGEQKKQYTTIGKLMIKDDGKMSVKMETTPLGWSGWASVYDQERKEQKADVVTAPTDEIPF